MGNKRNNYAIFKLPNKSQILADPVLTTSTLVGENIVNNMVSPLENLGGVAKSGLHKAKVVFLGRKKNKDLGASAVSAAVQVVAGSLTGTISIDRDVDAKAVVGTTTAFTTELAVGDAIRTAGGQTRIVASITDDTNLTVTSDFTADETGVAITKVVAAGQGLKLTIPASEIPLGAEQAEVYINYEGEQEPDATGTAVDLYRYASSGIIPASTAHTGQAADDLVIEIHNTYDADRKLSELEKTIAKDNSDVYGSLGGSVTFALADDGIKVISSPLTFDYNRSGTTITRKFGGTFKFMMTFLPDREQDWDQLATFLGYTANGGVWSANLNKPDIVVGLEMEGDYFDASPDGTYRRHIFPAVTIANLSESEISKAMNAKNPVTVEMQVQVDHPYCPIPHFMLTENRI